MRDVLLAMIVIIALPFILRQPRIGIMMWIWLSVMNPHKQTFGFAHDFNWVTIVAGVTLFSIVISRELRKPPANALTVLMFLFVAWTGVTTVFALHQEASFEFWKSLNKTILLAFLIPMLFHTKEQVRQLLWVVVLSIAYYGTKGGLWILLTGGGERVFGPGGYMEDNNALAVGVLMIIPLMRYLQLTSPHRLVRRGLLVIMLLCGVAVLGSYSRGALLAATMVGVFLWWKGRHKLGFLMVAVLSIPLVLAYLPDKWFERMDTMSEYMHDEGSAMARLNSWATMFNIALDRPLVGGGFMVAERDVYDKYSPDKWRKAHVAHSIYFQALGEHGFVGLGLYLGLFLALWLKASAMIRATSKRADLLWARDFAAMLHVTLVAFAVGGAFLSLVNFDVPYYLIGIMVVMMTIVDKELKAPAPVRPAAAPAPPLTGIGRAQFPGSRGGR